MERGKKERKDQLRIQQDSQHCWDRRPHFPWQEPLPPRNSHRSGGRSGSLEPAGMPHKKCPWLWEPGRSPLKDFLGSGSQGQSPK